MFYLHRRKARISLLILLLGSLTTCAGPAQASFPSRPIDVITHASPGGGTDTTARAMLIGAKLALRVNMAVVPKTGGGGEVVTNLMGGNIDAAGLNLTEALDQIKRGDFRALAVMRDSRLDTLKEIPTTVELGYDVTFSTVRGYVALRGTPEDRLRVLEQGMLKGLEHPAFQNYLKGAGLDPGSIAGSEIWAAQIDHLYQDALKAMIDLGMITE